MFKILYIQWIDLFLELAVQEKAVFTFEERENEFYLSHTPTSSDQ